MDLNNLAALGGQPRPIVVGGETYHLHPLTLDDFGALQAWADAQRPDPFPAAIRQIESGKLTVAQQKYLLQAALELASKPGPKLGTPECDALFASPEGMAEVLRLSVARGRPAFTAAEAMALLHRMGAEKVSAEFVRRVTDADMVISDPKGSGTAGGTSESTPPTGGPSTTAP